VQREFSPGTWTDVATHGEQPPPPPRRFTKWLASQTGLTFDLAWDAVEWLREQSPSRFSDPYGEEELATGRQTRHVITISLGVRSSSGNGDHGI
jgi:hypothetical protein